MMDFGLEDMRNNTILGTPIEELLPLAEEIMREIGGWNDGEINK